MALFGIQLHFTNGIETPMFIDQNQLQNFKQPETTQIDMTRKIKKISLRIYTVSGPYIRGIRFMDELGQYIVNLDGGNGDWVTQELGDDESIIGVYGKKTNNVSSVFNSLGFIVWNN